MFPTCKKVFVSFSICFILICNLFTPSTMHIHAAEPPEILPVDMITFQVSNDDVIFYLKTISTVNYMWDFKTNRDDIVKLSEVNFLSSDAARDSGTYLYKFTGGTRGFVDIKFTYLRTWKFDSLAYQNTFRIAVNSQGKVISVYSLLDNHSIHATIHDGLCTFAIPGEYNMNFGWALDIKPWNIIEMTWRDFIYYPMNKYDCMYYYTCRGIQPGKVRLLFTYRELYIDAYKPDTECFKLIVDQDLRITYADYVSQLYRED